MAKTKLTDKLCDKICEEIKAGTPMKHAAISHGISSVTFYNWYNRGKEAKSGKFKRFYEQVEEAKSVAITLRTRRIYKAGKDNWQADAWWLERVAPQEFGRKDKLNVNADVKTQQNINLQSQFNNDKIRQILKGEDDCQTQ